MAAQDAELQLKVSLDLSFFRQQLAGLGQAAAGYQLPIKFDRRRIQNELNALQKNISQRNYRLNVETNLAAEIKKAEKLARALNALPRGGGVQGGAGVTQKGFSQAALKQLGNDIKILYKGLGDAGLVAFNKSIANNRKEIAKELSQVGRDVIGGFLNGLKDGDPKVAAAAKALGQAAISSIKTTLGIASPSREFKKIGENIGEGLQQGMLSSVDRAFDAVENLMRARMRVLDTIARGMFRMAGVDPAAIRAEAAQRRALPGVNFPATIPPRNIPIGPSGTGRALPPGATPAGLPGSAFGAQKYLPTALSDELKQILRGAAFAFVDSLKQQVRSTRVGIAPSQQPLLGAGRIAGLLPPSIGRTPNPYSTGAIGGETRTAMLARREREARMRSVLRGVDVMGEGPRGFALGAGGSGSAGPYRPYAQPPAGGAIVPYTGGGGAGGGRGGGGMAGFGGDFFAGISKPSGLLSELTQEFSNATKQVLLFGTAYKALAAVTSLPGNIMEATANLQTFNNQMEAVTGGGEAMEKGFALVESTVAKFNMPLDAARQGFIRLYASMAPAGIAQGTIENLFTGLAASSRTLGLSADQVDRMTYALSQMASKGQITSEELKGQLGDVFPQAVSLFAEAAGFLNDKMDDQAKAKGLASFLGALEDGAFRGEEMARVLANVGVLLNKDFGASGLKAANSFRGQMDALANATKTFYESFAPAASALMGEFIQPLISGFTSVGAAIELALSGKAIQDNPLAAYFKNELFPQLLNIKNAVLAAAQTFSVFGQIIAAVLRPIASLILGNEQLLSVLARGAVALAAFRVGAALLGASGIIPLVRNILNYNVAMRVFITQSNSGVGAMAAMRAASVQAGMGFTQAAQGVRILATTIRVALVQSAIGIALVAIGALIEKIMQLQATAASIKGQKGAYATRLQKAGEAGGTQALASENRNVQQEIRSRRQSMDIARRLQQGGAISSQERDILSRAGGYEGTLGSLVKVGTKYTPRMTARGSAAGIEEYTPDVSAINADLKNANAALQSSMYGMAQGYKTAAANAKVVDARFKGQDLLKPGAAVTGDGAGATGAEPKPYIEEKSKELELEKELELLRIRKKALLGQISAVEANQQMVSTAKRYEEMEVNAEYEEALKKLNNEKLSANDKLLKQKDLLQVKQSKLNKIELSSDLERLAKVGDLTNAIDDYKFKIDEQGYALDRYKSGLDELGPAEKAHLEIMKLEKMLGPELTQEYKARLDELRKLTTEYYANADAIRHAQDVSGAKKKLGTIGAGLKAGFIGSAGSVFESALESNKTQSEAEELARLEEQAMRLRAVFDGIGSAINGVGSAFGSLMTEGIGEMIAGTATAKEVFGNFLKSVGQALQQAAAQMIATYVAIGIARIFAGLSGGGQASSDPLSKDSLAQMQKYSTGLAYANGGIAPGGFKAFANGGVVNGPTLGLVGEGKYNEAIVPLPDGKSIPVQMKGESIGDKMKTSQAQAASPVLSMKFETTKIGNIEYVSKDQLEQAMMMTQSLAAKQGAAKGASMAIDKLVQSPSTRKKVGLG